MNLLDLEKLMETGKFVLESNGHRINDRVFRRILESLQRRIDVTKKIAEKDNDTSELTRSICRNTPFAYNLDINYECYQCGALLHLVLKDDDTFELVDIEFLSSGLHDRSHKINRECLFNGVAKAIEYDLKVDSPLYFVNHFGNSVEDEPDEESAHTRGYNINAHIGRYNVSKVLAHKNIGYGQTGNSTAHVHFNKDSNTIYLIRSYIEDTISDYEYCIKEGYDITENDSKQYNDAKELLSKVGEYIGEIDMSCWRWMCADETTCKEHNLVFNNDCDVDEYNKDPRSSDEVVKVNVPHGNWHVKHFGCTDERNDLIWATLQLTMI